ncbi:formin-2-like protein, partial [Lates japonicus]
MGLRVFETCSSNLYSTHQVSNNLSHKSVYIIPPLAEGTVVRMQTIKTVETQVPFLKESFFTTTFKGRRKSSVTNIL